MKKYSLVFVLLSLSIIVATAQIKIPPLSPTFTVNGTVGFTEVEIVYSRPGIRSRKVEGNLIPYNEVWRTGANASTKISFSEEVKLNSNSVPAGNYALYSIFTEESATIILSKDTSLWGAFDYDSSEDLLRFEVPVTQSGNHRENFTINFSDITRNSANLNLFWGTIKVMFNIEADADERVMADIKSTLINNSSDDAGNYWLAASYYYDTNRDSKKALEWANLAIEKREEEGYWDLYLKAKLLARLGRKEEAIAVAERSIILAKENENPDYVRLNENLIASLK